VWILSEHQAIDMIEQDAVLRDGGQDDVAVVSEARVGVLERRAFCVTAAMATSVLLYKLASA